MIQIWIFYSLYKSETSIKKTKYHRGELLMVFSTKLVKKIKNGGKEGRGFAK